MRFNHIAILVPVFILLASAVAFGTYHPTSFGSSVALGVPAVHADSGGGGASDGGNSGGGGAGDGMGNDASGTGSSAGGGASDVANSGGGGASDVGNSGGGGASDVTPAENNPGGSEIATPPATPTCVLTANPTSILKGGVSQLSWNSTNATSASLDNGIGAVAPTNSSISVHPTTTTTYKLTVAGSGGTVVCTATVIVVPPQPRAPTCVLTANPTSILKGGVSQLSWTSTNATSASLDNGIGAVAPTNSSISVHPTTTTTYKLTVAGSGGTVVCTATVIVVPPQPHAPNCTLLANPTTITTGGSSTLSWTSTNATTFSIDHSIGSVTPVSAGSVSASPTVTTTYTGTATGPAGTATCTATVTVMPKVPNAPTCTLVANPTSIQNGDASTLTWTTTNTTTFSIDHSIGSVTPVSSGSKSVSPTVTTTYTGTATGPGGTTICTAPVTVTAKPPGAPSCTLVASPTAVNSGDHATLTWTTSNADTFTIDQSVGAVTPVAAGSVSSKAITSNTTFTGTAVSPSGQVSTCTAAVTVNTGGGGGGGPSCTMTVSPSSYTTGGRATLTWGGSEILNVDIDNGVATATSSPGSTVVAPANLGSYTYTGTFHATNGQTLTCKAVLTVTGGSGGGGGGELQPVITLSSLPHATTQPLTYLYLSQIPYTGLDLGPLGTVLYWAALIGWSIALAYLVLFGALPFAKRKLQSFGEQVSATLNAPTTPVMAFEMASPAPAPVWVAPRVMLSEAEESDTTDRYSPFDGFKSFAREEVLSVEDIVKGLSRSAAAMVKSESPAVVPVTTAPVAEWVDTPTALPSAPVAPAREEAIVPVSVRGMVAAILERDKEAVFAALRMHVRGGGEPEALLSPAVCLIDDVYRSRIDGTPCDETVSRLAARLDTPTLEKLVASLTTAIDSSYSTSVTGAKLALTRALAALGA